MRRLSIAVIAAASTVAFTQIAVAADMPVKAPLAPVAAPYNWTGFYAGANVGYSWGRSSSTLSLSDATSGAVLNSVGTTFSLDGVIGGGQIGYNRQFTNWVLGLEADIQASGQKGSTTGTCAGGSLASVATLNSACSPGHIGDTTPFNVAGPPVTENLSEKLNWFGTVRGRIGSTITPKILAYVTGGLAFGEVSTSDTVSGTNLVGPQGVNGVTIVPVSGTFSNNTTKIGWTIGGGIEGALWGNWTGKIEYLYLDLGTVSGAFVTPIIAPSGAFVTASYSSHVTDNIVRVGLNYRFH